MKGVRYYLPGGLVITAGLLILAFPEILVAIVAAFIILAGAFGLYIGHRMRQADQAMKEPNKDYDYGWRFPGPGRYKDF